MRAFAPVIVALLLIEQIAASFHILCDAPGPRGHLRIETVFGACCHKHDADAACGSHTAPASGMTRPCSEGCGECGDCIDTPLRFLLAAGASRAAPAADAPITPSNAIPEPASLLPVSARTGHDPTGPPTYLLTLRILV